MTGIVDYDVVAAKLRDMLFVNTATWPADPTPTENHYRYGYGNALNELWKALRDAEFPVEQKTTVR